MIDLTAFPPDQLAHLADGAIRNSDFEGAERVIRELLRRSPNNVECLLRLVDVLRAQGSKREALMIARRAAGVAPRDYRAQATLAGALSSNGQLEQAGRIYPVVLSLNSSDPSILTSFGGVLERLRRPEEAKKCAEQAVQLDPTFGPALNLLGQFATDEGDDSAAEMWLMRAISDSAEPEARSTGWHRLGTLREKQKRWDEAFQCHDRANRVLINTPAARYLRKESVFDHLPSQFNEGCEHTLARWGAREFKDGPPDPVFLVGFPRSGTTMTENILAAIPGSVTTDEEPVLTPTMQMAIRMCGDPPMSELANALDKLTFEQLVQLRAEYWKTVARLVSPDAWKARLFVDKAPLRFMHALFLNLLFPKCRVVFVVRDPRDCCLSCFFQDFALNGSMVRFLALESTGDTYAEVMTFWMRARTKLTIPWMEVRYEDLVSDFETHARKLVSFIGREWSDDILRFHEKASGRPIRTPSYKAVSEKVNTRAVGKWARYETHLGPLIERVRPFLGPLGYEE